MPDLDAAVQFLQQLIRIPSLSGGERKIAALVAREMNALGYADVHIDDVGNVLGRIPGRGEAPPVMFNTHLDHVDVGDPTAWPHPPMGAEVHDGKVWGRGAVDIKGPLSAQVHGVAALIERGVRPAGDVLVTAVVQEEIGGLGARHLAPRASAPWIVVGEPSRNTLRRGHRGRCELHLHIYGRSAHASVPHEAVSPYPVLARFIAGLENLEMRVDPELGPSTVALTLIACDQSSANVIPAELRVSCDWRNVPGESAEEARRALQTVAEAACNPGAHVEVVIPVAERTSYTGASVLMASDMPSYILRLDHPLVATSREALRELLGDAEPGVWSFATDGGHFASAGLAPIGYGPGDELLAHTVREHLAIADLEVALRGNELLALHLPEALKRPDTRQA